MNIPSDESGLEPLQAPTGSYVDMAFSPVILRSLGEGKESPWKGEKAALVPSRCGRDTVICELKREPKAGL